MTTMQLTDERIADFRRQHQTGTSIHDLAAQVGLSWQKLVMILRYGPGKKNRALVVSKTPAAVASNLVSGPLTERYRPRRLEDMFGQDAVVRWLRNFAAKPYPAVFIFDGDTGTGKTSAAWALAGALGCDLSAKPAEFGGVHSVASGEQTADTVRDIHRRMWQSPFSGSGWKVVIVNEADRMHPAAETIWLDRLEELPPRTVIVFTTNYREKLSQRFRDRCGRIAFLSSCELDHMEPAALKLAEKVWKAETGKTPRGADRAAVRRAAAAGKEGDAMSFRRVVQAVQKELMVR